MILIRRVHETDWPEVYGILRATFQAGDTFFVPLGTPNAWTSEGFLRKIFVIFQPKA